MGSWDLALLLMRGVYGIIQQLMTDEPLSSVEWNQLWKLKIRERFKHLLGKFYEMLSQQKVG